ncbi:MAG: hypothetical protein ACFCVK_06265 [Acidimicrobiales bacterium]
MAALVVGLGVVALAATSSGADRGGGRSAEQAAASGSPTQASGGTRVSVEDGDDDRHSIDGSPDDDLSADRPRHGLVRRRPPDRSG